MNWSRLAYPLPLLGSLLLPSSTLADNWHVIDLHEVRLDYRRFHESGRDPLFVDSTPKEGLDLGISTNILRYFGWDSIVHSKTNAAQYKYVSLETRLYLRVTESLEVGYYHHSQHLLDSAYPHQRFPVADALQINLYIYRAKGAREGLL